MASEQLELLNLCLALLWLGFAILYARANRPKETYQLRRVPRAAAAFLGGYALNLTVLTLLAGELGILEFHYLLNGLILFGMVGFLVVLIVDIVAMLLRAKRTPLWLGGGVVLAIAITYGLIFVVVEALWGAGPSPRSPVFFTPGLIGAATAIVWWSELPRPESTDPGVFD
jgi:hypothetical protein